MGVRDRKYLQLIRIVFPGSERIRTVHHLGRNELWYQNVWSLTARLESKVV